VPLRGDRDLARAYLAQAAAELQAAQGLVPAKCDAPAVAHAHAATELAVKSAIILQAGFDGGLFSHYAARLLRTRLPTVWKRTPSALRTQIARLDDAYPTRQGRRNFRYPYTVHAPGGLPTIRRTVLVPAAGFAKDDATTAVRTARAVMALMRRGCPGLATTR